MLRQYESSLDWLRDQETSVRSSSFLVMLSFFVWVTLNPLSGRIFSNSYTPVIVSRLIFYIEYLVICVNNIAEVDREAYVTFCVASTNLLCHFQKRSTLRPLPSPDIPSQPISQ